ncbi:hypothetical protein ASPZODRAFT_67483 [Penicilliopsis zonata CBS 506.65]|uniref:Uncharacterized protein n=1 Tax=Penicilliopsis zonata CBS 506.65 TaxID=1073090 RepID=A0A1L9SGL8_9EURO|nr:hypothetical protein ASPZODRAFT_67483 [Penicilliopsis zonata CBS 506.65]OJJ46263.1 hypothetical protein ASPZODRAFT_67483 [Penicilliopsis zonata CBS 506.65]
MVELIQPPEPHSLLPPLLACLPTAFVSPRPPPALLPLLSPILRQRVQILSSVSNSASDSWLRLLCWNADKAERVQNLVDSANFEPHPASGEIELPHETPVTFRRIDDETLQSQILLPDHSLKVIYLWCIDDKDGGGPGWRLAELLPDEDSLEDNSEWSTSVGEANSRAKEKIIEDALKAAEKHEQSLAQGGQMQDKNQEDDDGEDDYWAQYDATPGRTPAVKTPAPNPISPLHQSHSTEDSYYARYADVQPAMDNEDPEEQQTDIGASTLDGNMLMNLLQRQISRPSDAEPPRTNGYAAGATTHDDTAMLLNHPRPASVSSRSSESAVAKLELEAENRSVVEVGVRQHISANIKSLFRLAKSTGISRAEFDSLVKTELDLLSLSDHDP